MSFLQSQPRTASLFTASQAANQSIVDHVLEVSRTYTAMEKNGLTVDDLIDAYNRGTQQAIDYSLEFFFSAYAIVLHEQGRDVLEGLDQFPMPAKSSAFPLSNSRLDELIRRGITQRDLEKVERLGERNIRKDMGIDELLKALNKIEGNNLADRVQELIDEEITAADIMERCKRETGVDIKHIVG